MGIFNKPDQQADYTSNITTIAAGSRFSGKLEIVCKLHVDGEFDGDIVSENIVEIGKTGSVSSHVVAKKLIISGKYTGDAECDAIEVVAGGEAEGRLTCVSLIIDSDSAFQGESIRRRAEDLPQSGAPVVDFPAEHNPFAISGRER